MRILNTKLKKTIFWISLAIITLVVIIVAFISPLTKWAIEKYDVKYSGRQITLDMAYVNPFTGYVHFKNLKIYEANSDSVFFSTSISTNFEMLKLLSKTYEISYLTLNNPVAKIIQDTTEFNFSDLIKKFSSKDSLPKKEPSQAIHINILNLKIENGTFFYIEKSIPIFYSIKKVNIETSGKRWDSDKMNFKFSLASGINSGDLSGIMDLNTNTKDYKLATKVNKFDLSILGQYVKGIANYGLVRGNIDADLNAEGNFTDAQNLNAKGFLAVNDFHIGKNASEDYASFQNLSLGIIQLSPKGKKYFFDSISLVKPYFKYERYDYLDNLQYMFGKEGEAVEKSKEAQAKTNILFQIGEYVQLLAKNFFKSDYKVKRLAIYNANLLYTDYTLKEKFTAAVSPLTIIADSIERSDKWVNLKLRAGLKPFGNMGLDISINPHDSSDFNFQFYINKLPMAMLNPYFINYTSFPIDRGFIEVKSRWTVRNGIINSDNKLTIIDPRVNNRQKRNGAKWLPLRFFMFFVRERGNVIDYDIPIKGDLRDPKFKFKDVIFDVLTNVFLKPLTLPYRTQVRNVENELEKSLNLKWMMRGAEFNNLQEEFIENIVEFLKDNPSESITAHPEFYTEKEKEYILLFEAKKIYFMHLNGKKTSEINESDSTDIERLSIKDSLFVHFLNKKASKDLHTVQEKCNALVSNQSVAKKLRQLTNARKGVFLAYFRENQLTNQVRIAPVKETIPFNGFSLYRISYKGSLPDNVLQAYREINQLDDENPRKKFKQKRKGNLKLLDKKIINDNKKIKSERPA